MRRYRPALSLDLFQPEETHPFVTLFGNTTPGGFSVMACAVVPLIRRNEPTPLA